MGFRRCSFGFAANEFSWKPALCVTKVEQDLFSQGFQLKSYDFNWVISVRGCSGPQGKYPLKLTVICTSFSNVQQVFWTTSLNLAVTSAKSSKTFSISFKINFWSVSKLSKLEFNLYTLQNYMLLDYLFGPLLIFYVK